MPGDNIASTKRTSQAIDNLSFDEGLLVRVTEIVGADGVLKNPATEETLLTIAQGGTKYATRIDDVSTTNVTYVGKAVIGASTASAVWQIMKIDESGTPETMVITWADGDAGYNNVWDNRTSLTYA